MSGGTTQRLIKNIKLEPNFGDESQQPDRSAKRRKFDENNNNNSSFLKQTSKTTGKRNTQQKEQQQQEEPLKKKVKIESTETIKKSVKVEVATAASNELNDERKKKVVVVVASEGNKKQRQKKRKSVENAAKVNNNKNSQSGAEKAIMLKNEQRLCRMRELLKESRKQITQLENSAGGKKQVDRKEWNEKRAKKNKKKQKQQEEQRKKSNEENSSKLVNASGGCDRNAQVNKKGGKNKKNKKNKNKNNKKEAETRTTKESQREKKARNKEGEEKNKKNKKSAQKGGDDANKTKDGDGIEEDKVQISKENFMDMLRAYVDEIEQQKDDVVSTSKDHEPAFKKCCSILKISLQHVLVKSHWNKRHYLVKKNLEIDFLLIDQIIEQAARIEPKNFAKVVARKLSATLNDNATSKDDDKESLLKLQIFALWALSAVLCIFAQIHGSNSDESAKEQCMAEAKELRSMAKDLEKRPDEFDCAPLVDLLISWTLNWGKKSDSLLTFSLFAFVSRLQAAHVQQIVETFTKTNSQLLGEDDAEEEEDGEEQGEEEEDDNDDNVGGGAQFGSVKREVIDVDEVEEEEKDDDEEEEEDSEEDEEEDEKEEDDGDNEKVTNKQLVIDVRNALSDAGFTPGETEVSSGGEEDEDWNLNDERLFALDKSLAEAFLRHSKKGIPKSKLMRRNNARVVELLRILFQFIDVNLALPAWLSVVSFFCEGYFIEKEKLAKKLLSLAGLFEGKKLLCKFDTDTFLTFLRALFVPFERDSTKVEEQVLCSKHNILVLSSAVRVLLVLSAVNYNKLSEKIHQFMSDLRAKCFAFGEKSSKGDALVEFSRPKRVFLLSMLSRLVRFFVGGCFCDWLILCCKEAADSEASFEKRFYALSLATSLMNQCNKREKKLAASTTAASRQKQLNEKPLFERVAQLLVKNLSLFKPDVEEEEEEARPVKKKRRVEMAQPIESTNNGETTNCTTTIHDNRWRTLFLVRFIQTLHHFCNLAGPEALAILQKGVQKACITDLRQTIERTLGEKGMKILLRRVISNCIYLENTDNTFRSVFLKRPLSSYGGKIFRSLEKKLKLVKDEEEENN